MNELVKITVDLSTKSIKEIQQLIDLQVITSDDTIYQSVTLSLDLSNYSIDEIDQLVELDVMPASSI